VTLDSVLLADVQVQACAALLNLLRVSHVKVRLQICSEHGIQAVVAGMSAHPGMRDLQRAGSCVLRELVKDAETREYAARVPHSIRCVLVAIHTHQFDEILQQAACQYLRCLASSDVARTQVLAELQTMVMDSRTRRVILDIVKNAACFSESRTQVGGFGKRA
jgi:hypothetical protein